MKQTLILLQLMTIMNKLIKMKMVVMIVSFIIVWMRRKLEKILLLLDKDKFRTKFKLSSGIYMMNIFFSMIIIRS